MGIFSIYCVCKSGKNIDNDDSYQRINSGYDVNTKTIYEEDHRGKSQQQLLRVINQMKDDKKLDQITSQTFVTSINSVLSSIAFFVFTFIKLGIVVDRFLITILGVVLTMQLLIQYSNQKLVGILRITKSVNR